jgi:hypothetical protein
MHEQLLKEYKGNIEKAKLFYQRIYPNLKIFSNKIDLIQELKENDSIPDIQTFIL